MWVQRTAFGIRLKQGPCYIPAQPIQCQTEYILVQTAYKF